MKKLILLGLMLSASGGLQILLAQNVGVNDDGTAPAELLHVKSTAAGADHGVLIQSTAKSPFLQFYQGTVAPQFTLGVDQADANKLKLGTTTITTNTILTVSGTTIGIGTTTPTSTALLTINPTTNAIRTGIDMTMSAATSNAYALNIAASNGFSRGVFYANTTTSASNVVFGTGTSLTGLVAGEGANAGQVSGYLSYRNSIASPSNKSYGIYGITGTDASYTTNDFTYAAFLQGRTVISSESSPTSLTGTDLEVRNTTATATAPATLSLRQTNSLAASGNILAYLNFGDNYVTTPQAQIQVLRDAAAGSTADMPTAMTFSTIADAASTLTERMRITNAGTVQFNAYTTNGIVRTTGGTGTLSSSGGAISLTTEVTGTLPVGNGGTGLTAIPLGILRGDGASAITGTTGTLYGVPYFATTSTLGSTAAGTTTQVLHGNAAGAPTYSAVSLTADITGTLPVGNGGTGATTLTGVLIGNGAAAVTANTGTANYASYWATANTLGSEQYLNVTRGGLGANMTAGAIGAIPYSTSTTAYGTLADVATGNALISGGVGVAPSFGKIALTTHVSGTLPIANGGTNNTAFTSGSVIFYDGTKLAEKNANFFWDNTNNRLGIGTAAPSYFLHITGSDANRIAQATNTNAAGDGFYGVNSAAVGTSSGAGIVGITQQGNNGLAAGVWGQANASNGTGTIGAGNGVGPVILALGSGGSFTSNNVGSLDYNSSTTTTGQLYGAWGAVNSLTGYTNNTGVMGTGAQYGVMGYSTPSSPALAGGYFGNAYSANYAIAGHWNGYKILGSGTVSTIKITKGKGRVVLHAPETPGVWFEDMGIAQMVNGHVKVDIDPVFLECVTINQQYPFMVMVTPMGEVKNQVIVKKGASSFEIIEINGGTSNCEIAWRLTATWKDWEGVRFEEGPGPASTEDDPEGISDILSEGYSPSEIPHKTPDEFNAYYKAHNFHKIHRLVLPNGKKEETQMKAYYGGVKKIDTEKNKPINQK